MARISTLVTIIRFSDTRAADFLIHNEHRFRPQSWNKPEGKPVLDCMVEMHNVMIASVNHKRSMQFDGWLGIERWCRLRAQ